MKRFFQGVFILVGSLFALVIVLAAPAVLFIPVFIGICWGIGRLAFGKSAPKEYKPEKDLITPTKETANKVSKATSSLFSVINSKVLKPVVSEVKDTVEAKRKLKQMEAEMEMLKKERAAEAQLSEKLDEEVEKNK